MDIYKKGYWAIASQKHLNAYAPDSSNIDEFDNIDLSGKTGRFLGAIRGNTKIDDIKRIEKIGNSVGIKPRELHSIILPKIEEWSDKKVEVKRDSTGNVEGIAEYLVDNKDVIEITGNIFEKSLESSRSSSIELITLETLEATRKIPFIKSELIDELLKYGFKEEDIVLSVNLQGQFHLIQLLDKLNPKDPIISNEYVWGTNHEKIAYGLSKVSIDDKKSIQEVIDNIREYQGLPTSDIKCKKDEIVNLTKKIGMIDTIQISSNRGLNKSFEFSADISNDDSFSDIMDDVKVLIAAVRFGQKYTEYSTISNPVSFIEALINHDSVGPHSANSTDYTLLEKKGIVKVEKKSKTKFSYGYGSYNVTGPCLKLLKKDVGEKALEVLKSSELGISGDILPDNYDSLIETSDYVNAEVNRIKMAELPEPIKEAHEYLTRVLRDEEI